MMMHQPVRSVAMSNTRFSQSMAGGYLIPTRKTAIGAALILAALAYVGWKAYTSKR
jgi:hypothetical protein